MLPNGIARQLLVLALPSAGQRLGLGSAGQRWVALGSAVSATGTGSAGQRLGFGSAGQRCQRWAAACRYSRCPAVKKALNSAALKLL